MNIKLQYKNYKLCGPDHRLHHMLPTLRAGIILRERGHTIQLIAHQFKQICYGDVHGPIKFGQAQPANSSHEYKLKKPRVNLDIRRKKIFC